MDSINWKDKDSFLSIEDRSLDIGVKLTSNSCSLNSYTEIISYKSTSVNYNVAEASNCQSKCSILDQLYFETSNLQDNCISTTFICFQR